MPVNVIRSANLANIKRELLRNQQNYPNSKWLYSNKGFFVKSTQKLDDKYLNGFNKIFFKLVQEMSRKVMNRDDIKSITGDIEFLAKNVRLTLNRNKSKVYA